MSALITRASISSVAPGRVAIRAPASVAARRAAVCESDWTVGARTTSAAAIAAATEAGGSAACEPRSVISAITASAPSLPASPRSRVPSPIVAGLQITSTSSPSRTPRHSRTIAVTARSRSLTQTTLASEVGHMNILAEPMPTPYTHKKLTEVKDSAPKFGFSETQEARFASRDLDTEQTGLSHLRVRPNARQAFAHKHENAEEVYVILSGAGRVKLDDEIVELAGRDAIRVSPGVIRQFEAGPEGLEILAFGPKHDRDGETFPGWWTDE